MLSRVRAAGASKPIVQPETALSASPPAYAAYAAAQPYFDLVRGALGDLVHGAHFFDAVADDIAYEVLYDFPGWPRLVRGREALMAQFAGYAANMTLSAADHLVVHRAEGGVVVLEYEVHGTVAATGARYDNRFASILTVSGRRIVRWRDYMDSLAAWNTITGGR
ncbi:nuclear transport factor 2 family protein [Caulobacter sp. KR2-114]|uniref:nuclear transport factor 2 family protein n=1 Tax=Caulobacter sp. KR2-114 TaxID=3400912 RepID=UPI003C00E3D2